MIEAGYGNPKYAQQYAQCLAGTFTLGANEIYQFGFRLAALSHDRTIYPIDTIADFPFDYPAVHASAKVSRAERGPGRGESGMAGVREPNQ